MNTSILSGYLTVLNRYNKHQFSWGLQFWWWMVIVRSHIQTWHHFAEFCASIFLSALLGSRQEGNNMESRDSVGPLVMNYTSDYLPSNLASASPTVNWATFDRREWHITQTYFPQNSKYTIINIWTEPNSNVNKCSSRVCLNGRIISTTQTKGLA